MPVESATPKIVGRVGHCAGRALEQSSPKDMTLLSLKTTRRAVFDLLPPSDRQKMKGRDSLISQRRTNLSQRCRKSEKASGPASWAATSHPLGSGSLMGDAIESDRRRL